MHTTRLETVCVSVVTTRCYSGGLGGRSSNDKFEQVSSNHHQMSLAVGVGMSEKGGCSPYYVTCPMMHVM